MENTGVLLGRQETDYVAGTIPYEIRNEEGNWQPFLPLGEWQQKNGKDLMACVTFSLLNAIETQEFFLTGQRVNYSDRWIAKMSGTTPEGNYLYKVADTVRKFGLVLEEDYPADSFEWNVYYQNIPEPKLTELKVKGAEWLKNHTLQYEWLDVTASELLKHLKQCPLQVVKPGHAIESFNLVEPSDVVEYFDSYSPFEKQMNRSIISDVLKPVLTIQNMNQFKTQNYKGELRVVLQASSMEEWKALCKVYGLNPDVITEVVDK